MSLQKNVKLVVGAGDYETLFSLIQNFDRKSRISLALIEKSLQKAIKDTGNKFLEGSIHFPDLLIAVRAVNKALSLLNQKIGENKDSMKKDTIVIATVKEKLYDIGETIASAMATATGFKVLYLGTIEQGEAIEEAIKKDNPHAVVLSGKPGTNVSTNYIKLMKELGVIYELKLVIPGTPVTMNFEGRYGIEILYIKSRKTKKFVQSLRDNFGVVMCEVSTHPIQ